jgi:hypothetical protein
MTLRPILRDSPKCLLLTAKELLDGIQIGKETRAKATTSQNTAGRSKKENSSLLLWFSQDICFLQRGKGLSLGQASRPKHCNGKKKNKPEYAKHTSITKQAKAWTQESPPGSSRKVSGYDDEAKRNSSDTSFVERLQFRSAEFARDLQAPTNTRDKKRETRRGRHTHTRKFSTRVFCARTRGPEEHSVELTSVLCGNRCRILRPRIRRRKRRSQRLSVDDAASCSRRRGDCRFLKQISIFCASSSWRPYSQLTNNKCFWFHSMLYGNCKTRQLENLEEDGNQIPQPSTDTWTISELACSSESIQCCRACLLLDSFQSLILEASHGLQETFEWWNELGVCWWWACYLEQDICKVCS